MGDRVSYEITIGGKMSADTLTDLLEAIEAEGLGVAWEALAVDELRAAFELAAANGRAVTLNAHEVNYATADFVEDHCRDHALPYVKEWDAGGGFGPGMEVFDGETVAEYACTGINGGGALLDLGSFRHLATREDVATWFERAAFAPPPIVIEEASEPADA